MFWATEPTEPTWNTLFLSLFRLKEPERGWKSDMRTLSWKSGWKDENFGTSGYPISFSFTQFEVTAILRLFTETSVINSIELVSSSARVTTCICCKFSPCITLSPSFGLFQSEKWQKKGVPGAAQCGSVDQNMPLYTEKKENLLLHQKCNFCEANFTGILLEMKT